MSTLNFPTSPSLNDTYSFGTKTWVWNGAAWQLNSAGAINNIPIGNVTPASGAFTTITGNTAVIPVITVNQLTSNDSSFVSVADGLDVQGEILATGNISGDYVLGNGSQLTGIASGGITWTTQANTAPANASPGDFWYNSATQIKYQYIDDGTGDFWVDQSSPTVFESITTGQIVNANANGVGNIGSAANTFNTVFAQSITTGLITATGNITGGNLLGTIQTAAQPSITSVGTLTALSVSGNVTGGNLLGTIQTAAQPSITSVGTLTALSVSGNVTGGNLITGGLISATGNITGGNVSTSGSITSASLVLNNGSADGGGLLLKSLGFTDWEIDNTNGTMRFFQPGVTYMQLATTGLSVTGNVTGGNLITAGLASLSSITKTGTNGVGNIGAAGSTFNTVFAKATSAQYADLAEIYRSDQAYEPGTVLVFGGTQEVTVSNISHDIRAAGVVSTEPAYLMNNQTPGVAVALTGRVPCRVRGPVAKGEQLVNITTGIAGAIDFAQYRPGCVIGKSLESIADSSVQVIEIAVGRF